MEELHLSQEVWDLIYPVGSICIFVNELNPNVLYGGTWEKIRDKFLLASGDTYQNGSTGGQDKASVQLEMFSLLDNKRLYFDYTKQNFEVPYLSNSRYMVEGNYGEESANYENQYLGLKVSNLNNTDTLMPPYLAVNVWKRIA